MSDNALTAFDPLNGTPVTIVFGTINYRDTVHQWIEAAERAGCDHWRIVCLDQELFNWLAARGYGAQAVDYYKALPDAPRYDFAALDPRDRMRALLPLRTRLFLHLARAGRDFIHSDADAIWIRDVRPWLAQQPGYDLLASQGTWWPAEQYVRHHFVLCAGFFLCRANSRTRAYFEQVEAIDQPDDQERMNLVLFNDPNGRWTLHRPVFRHLDQRRWRRASLGKLLLLAPLRLLSRLRLLGAKLSLHGPLRYIFTSREIIRGRFSNDLSVGVIPMHLVVRLKPPSPETLVTHGHRPTLPHTGTPASVAGD